MVCENLMFLRRQPVIMAFFPSLCYNACNEPEKENMRRLRWDEELSSLRQKQVMDQFTIKNELYSFELKRLAGFGKGGEKNFEGTVSGLQMGGYLLIRDFRQRLNKKGQPYGWPISVYATPETLWGYEHISSAYSVEPEQSRELIYQQVHKNFPAATEAALHAVLGWDR